MNVFSLKGRVAIITGSTKGIGHASACRMAEQVQKWLYPAIIRKPVMRWWRYLKEHVLEKVVLKYC